MSLTEEDLVEGKQYIYCHIKDRDLDATEELADPYSGTTPTVTKIDLADHDEFWLGVLVDPAFNMYVEIQHHDGVMGLVFPEELSEIP